MSDLQCPYCDYEIELCHDDGAYYDDNKKEECECPECEKTFMVSTTISFDHESYCTEGNHDWEKVEMAHGNSDWERERDIVGKLFYFLCCRRVNCEGTSHGLSEEEYNNHPAPKREE